MRACFAAPALIEDLDQVTIVKTPLVGILGELERAGHIDNSTRTVAGLSLDEVLAKWDVIRSDDPEVKHFYCAAPGGKTAQLVHAGAKVTAVDRDPARLARLRENLARLKIAAEIVQADAKEWRTDEKFDAVLLDAPCSATGTIRSTVSDSTANTTTCQVRAAASSSRAT